MTSTAETETSAYVFNPSRIPHPEMKVDTRNKYLAEIAICSNYDDEVADDELADDCGDSFSHARTISCAADAELQQKISEKAIETNDLGI